MTPLYCIVLYCIVCMTKDGAQLMNKAIRGGGGGGNPFSCKILHAEDEIHNLSLFELSWFHSKESVYSNTVMMPSEITTDTCIIRESLRYRVNLPVSFTGH